MRLRVGSHVRMREDSAARGGPPADSVGTVGLVVPRKHDDMPNFAGAIFDYDGTLVPGKTPRGLWVFCEEEVDVLQHCQSPRPCICGGSRDGEAFVGPVLSFGGYDDEAGQ